MFSFAKKNAVVEMNSIDDQLPDGCEALSECEFAEITGAAVLGVVAHL